MDSDEYEILETMEADEFYNDPTETEEKTINILIIGETGVGKSTFINAFANYLRFENLYEVERQNPIVLIPCKFTVTDENYELREVTIGSDTNENDELGQSSTQEPKYYTFPISNGQRFVRLIDTPGIGDTRGIDQDTLNCQRIIDFIAPLKSIHGIMFLMKPNSAKITVLFEFCMKQILSRLEKSASKNLLFVFTNTRGTCYRPGETLPCLRKVLEDISKRPPYVKIPLSKSNIYCLDNEAFRYLAAKANQVGFTERERQYFAESWDKSAEESWRMIIRITGDDENSPIEPHQVAQTVCVNDARDLINQLKKPLADITLLIRENLMALENHKKLLDLNNTSVEEMRKNLFIPIIDIEVIELSEPVTVCAAVKCSETYTVRGLTKYHYGQRCHNPCYLKNVPKEIIGAAELISCAAMGGQEKCRVCGCHYSSHMHIYYESKTVDRTIEDDNIKNGIKTQEEYIEEKKNTMKMINILKEEQENEHKIIIMKIAKFANFLQQNAITPYNDAYKQYIEYLIDEEKSLGKHADKEKINHLRRTQKEYDEAIKVFERASQLNEPDLTPEEVKTNVLELFNLKHNGKKIEELYNSQIKTRKSENLYNRNKKLVNTKDKDGKKGKSFVQKMKNYFSSKTETEAGSDEDNNTHDDTFENLKKGKGGKKLRNHMRKKENTKRDDYEDHLKEMEKESQSALVALNLEI